MHKLTPIFTALILFLPVFADRQQRDAAQAGDASAVIAEVNALRASYGLAPYEVDTSLMSAAQAHSNYQAELGTWTHTGPGGSRPHDRAVSAGYGGGAPVFISENVAMGVNMTPNQVVYQVWQDPIHLETMISNLYRHIGAGVASNGNHVFYTIDVGTIGSAPGSDADGTPAPGTTPGGPEATPGPTGQALVPILVATPRPDGMVIHVVQWGQFLENIAAAYAVSLEDLLALNGITRDTIIYEGDKLLVKVGVTTPLPQESTPTLTISNPPEPTPFQTVLAGNSSASGRMFPTGLPTDPASLALLSSPDSLLTASEEIQEGVSQPLSRDGPDYLLIAVIGLAASGAALVILGSALKRV